MAIQHIPTGFEGLANVLAGLGNVIGQAKWGQELQQQERRNALLSDPEMLRFLSPSMEANPELAARMGLPEGLGELITALAPPTVDQRVERAEAVDPEVLGTELGARKAERETRVPVAEATKAQAGAITAESKLAEQFANARSAEDIPALQAALEAAQARVGVDQVNLMKSHIDAYIELLPTMDPHMRMAAITGMVNPRFLSHVEHHETIENQWAMLRLKMSQGREMDQFALLKFRLDLAKEQSTAVGELQAANELKGEARTTAQNAAIARINGISRMHQELYPGEPFILAGARPAGFWAGLGLGDRKEALVRMVEGGSIADRAVAGLVTDRFTVDQLRSDPEVRRMFPALNDASISQISAKAEEIRREIGSSSTEGQPAAGPPRARSARAVQGAITEKGHLIARLQALDPVGNASRIEQLQREVEELQVELRQTGEGAGEPAAPRQQLRGQFGVR